MSFCFSHATFYRYGDCPGCLRTQVAALPQATQAQLVTRINQLLANPVLINQDQFGICGTTTAVHLLLRHRRAMLVNLFESTFAGLVAGYRGREFATAQHGNQAIDFTYLSRRFALLNAGTSVTDGMTRHRAALLAPFVPPAVAPQFFVDFCLSRALGYLFKRVAEQRYNDEKVTFNAEFDPINGGDYRNFTRAEGFALRTQNIAFIMQDLLGANLTAIAKNTAALNQVPDAPPVLAPTAFTTEFQFRNNFGARFAGGTSFAIAGIFAELINNADALGNLHQGFVRPGNLDYNHWVLINGYNHAPPVYGAACPHGHVTLNIWTWGAIHNITVCDIHLPDYLQDVVFGTL